jgi:hypothetical protein
MNNGCSDTPAAGFSPGVFYDFAEMNIFPVAIKER